MGGFAAQPRCAHAAIGKFKCGSDAKAHQRVVADAGWIGCENFIAHILSQPCTYFGSFGLIASSPARRATGCC